MRAINRSRCRAIPKLKRLRLRLCGMVTKLLSKMTRPVHCKEVLAHSTITQISAHSRNPKERCLSLGIPSPPSSTCGLRRMTPHLYLCRTTDLTDDGWSLCVVLNWKALPSTTAKLRLPTLSNVGRTKVNKLIVKSYASDKCYPCYIRYLLYYKSREAASCYTRASLSRRGPK